MYQPLHNASYCGNKRQKSDRCFSSEVRVLAVVTGEGEDVIVLIGREDVKVELFVSEAMDGSC